MSKKKKDKIEEPKKTKAAVKEKPAKAEKKGIVPARMPVLVPTTTTAEAPVSPAAPAPAPAAPKAKKAPAKKAPAKKKEKAAKPSKEAAAEEAAVEEPIVETVVVEEITISTDDIALRAYFISEARRSRGHGGDEHGDWVEAERQLRAEAGGKKK